MPAIRVYTSSGWQDVAVQGPAGATPTINPYWIGQTWGVGGVLTAGQFVPQMFIPERFNQSVTLVGVRAVINSGSSIGVQLQRNGVNVGSVITVSTTAAYTAYSPYGLSDGDRLGLVLSAPVGSPSDLSFTVILEHSAA